MTDAALLALAEASGVAPRWRDAFGAMREVAPDTLRHVLRALGVPADSAAEVGASLAAARAAAGQAGAVPLATAVAGRTIALAVPAGRYRIILEQGGVVEGSAEPGQTALPPIDSPGYHTIAFADRAMTLAVAPARCHGVRDTAPEGRLWGLAAQLYALRREGDGGIGDFAALTDFVVQAARAGADAVAISPIHAQFSADPDRFSPYSPSSRIAINVLHADADAILPPAAATGGSADMVDWSQAGRARLAHLRAAHALFAAAPGHPLAAEFAGFRAAGGEALELHARFEALHAHFFGASPDLWNWRRWPDAYRDPHDPAVAAFAAAHENEVGLHAFMQFLADRGLAGAQRAARDGGMRIGLISDLAVGTDGGGSHAWSRQGETLLGLSVGAPPDILNLSGQDWGLAAFSPTGLVRHGFGAYLEMLRAALRHAGGVRIDHVMGLARLWVLPEGAAPSEGAYLHYPLRDLLRLIALESHRHRAVVLGEDLGTLPDGFQADLDHSRLMGLRVLWFEAYDGLFKPPGSWTADAVAMTSTHDLATLAGWWSGHDLDLRRGLGLLGDDTAIWHGYENRARDRVALWDAFARSGAAASSLPPPPEQPAAAVDAGVRHVAGAACDLALLPVEDALGALDQPNLPGTTDQHPNWRRRLTFDARGFFTEPNVARRIALFAAGRRQPPTDAAS